MRFSATLIAMVFGVTALVSASPAIVEYVTVTQDAATYDAPAQYTDAPAQYQVSNEMPESDLYEMLCLLNKCRSSRGLDPLKLHSGLVKSAQVHSEHMRRINSMTHDDPRGGLGDRITSSGFPSWSSVSENIAFGQRTVDGVVEDWIASPSHLKNILGGTVYCGFGRSGNMWTQEFASPSSESLYPQGNVEQCPRVGVQQSFPPVEGTSNAYYTMTSVGDTNQVHDYVEQTQERPVYPNNRYVTKTVYKAIEPVYVAPKPVYHAVDPTYEEPTYQVEQAGDVSEGDCNQ